MIVKRAKKGVGIIAGGAMRYVFEALGIQDIVCKTYGSPSTINTIKATFKALQEIRSIKQIAEMRGIKREDLYLNYVEKENA